MCVHIAGMMWGGQLGCGHLTDFALTSGEPTGVWHANRLMSLFKCKFVGGSLKPHPVNSHKRNTSHTIRRRAVSSGGLGNTKQILFKPTHLLHG